MKRLFIVLLVLLFIGTIIGCSRRASKVVVVYTSLDQIFSEPIIEQFEKDSGITVKSVYDTEATKTTGLVNRLIAEKDNPRADVFWSSEVGRTIVLKEKGVLTPYVPENAGKIPEQFKDTEGYWTGFAARARVIIYNTELVKPEYAPRSIFDLTSPKWHSQVGLAYPLFGTTATHSAALFGLLGEEKAKNYFNDLKTNNVAILPGNSVVKDRVAEGELKVGLTDTDDANIAVKSGKPVAIVYPDQDGIGTLVIPNTLALVANSPSPDAAKRFIDYLISEEVEEKLVFSLSAQMPLLPNVKKPSDVPSVESIKTMKVDFSELGTQMNKVDTILQKIFIE
jgi:iron(III) transport system substrate-binding protein